MEYFWIIFGSFFVVALLVMAVQYWKFTLTFAAIIIIGKYPIQSASFVYIGLLLFFLYEHYRDKTLSRRTFIHDIIPSTGKYFIMIMIGALLAFFLLELIASSPSRCDYSSGRYC